MKFRLLLIIILVFWCFFNYTTAKAASMTTWSEGIYCVCKSYTKDENGSCTTQAHGSGVSPLSSGYKKSDNTIDRNACQRSFDTFSANDTNCGECQISGCDAYNGTPAVAGGAAHTYCSTLPASTLMPAGTAGSSETNPFVAPLIERKTATFSAVRMPTDLPFTVSAPPNSGIVVTAKQGGTGPSGYVRMFEAMIYGDYPGWSEGVNRVQLLLTYESGEIDNGPIIYIQIQKPDCEARIADLGSGYCNDPAHIQDCRVKCEKDMACQLGPGGTCKLTETMSGEDQRNRFSGQVKETLIEGYGKPDGYTGPIPDCVWAGQCRKANQLLELIINFGKWTFGVVGSFAFLMFVIGGFTMILSFGNAEKVKKGQGILVAAVVGLVISFSAYILIDFVLKTLNVQDEIIQTLDK